MKRLLALAVSLFLIMPSAIADVDLSSMSIEELRNLQNQIAVELSARKGNESTAEKTLAFQKGEKIYLVNDPYYQIYFTGKYRIEEYGKDVYFDVVCENSSSAAQSAWLSDIKLNGWTLSGTILFTTMQPGDKMRDTLVINYDSAMLDDCTGIEKLTFTLTTDDENYNLLHDYGAYTITFDPSVWGK